MDRTVISFLLVIGSGSLMILLSRALDALWARVVPVRHVYYIMRAPGIVVHELSHVLGCLVTGAKIKKVVLFSTEGGSVTYARPPLPFIGDMIIGTAPVVCIPLVLAGCTWVFSQYLGCVFPVFPQGAETVDDLFMLGTGLVSMFSRNLIVTFNPWFLVYLYLTLTLVLSLAPSGQDLKNAAAGICLLLVAGILIIWSSHPLALQVLSGVSDLIGIGFFLGLVSGIIALTASLPLIVLYIHRKT